MDVVDFGIGDVFVVIIVLFLNVFGDFNVSVIGEVVCWLVVMVVLW